MNWRDFWNSDTPLYVNERHKHLHYQQIAKDIIKFIPTTDSHVLDFGCGDALYANLIKNHCATLTLCDQAENTRNRLQNNAQSGIKVISPEHLAATENQTYDLIIVNSVLQYLKPDELETTLNLLTEKLKTSGTLVLADIIPPNSSAINDVIALLSFGLKGGFFFASLKGLVKTALSPYRDLRNKIGLSYYSKPDIKSILARHNLTTEHQTHNMGHNQKRMTFVARLSEAKETP